MASTEQPDLLEPSEAEIEEWAAREQKRRERWLSGPTAEEKAAWAWRERERRLTERLGSHETPRFRSASRLLQRSVRELQLSVEGGASLLFNLTLDGVNRVFNLSLSETKDQLVRAGLEWEADLTRQPARRPHRSLDEPAATSPASVEREQAAQPD
jgi:hypothetical protein